MRPALRRNWLKLHRWVALGLGWVLVLAGFLGALLLLAKPLDQWAHPELFRQQAATEAAAAPLDAVRSRLEQEFGPAGSFTFRPPREPHDTLWVYVNSGWKGVVYFDAAGRELGRRGEYEGAYNLLFELHSALLLGDTGKAVLATAAGLYMFLMATGVALWWPRRWPPSFRIHWRAGVLRASVELHNAAGVLLGIFIAVSVATGAYMAWPPLRPFVSSLAGDTPVAAPKVPAAPSGAAPGSLARMAATAKGLFPEAMIGYVQVTGDRAVRIRLKLPDDPHPNGLTSVWLHPRTGEVLRVARWSELDSGHRLVATVYPLHTGVLGGPVHEVLVGITGLALATLGGSGLLLWWKRRRLATAPAVRGDARRPVSR